MTKCNQPAETTPSQAPTADADADAACGCRYCGCCWRRRRGRGGQKSLEEDDQVRRATSGQCVHGRWKAVRTGFQLLEGTHMGHTDHTKVPYRSCLACCVHTLSGIVDVHHGSTLTGTATARSKATSTAMNPCPTRAQTAYCSLLSRSLGVG